MGENESASKRQSVAKNMSTSDAMLMLQATIDHSDSDGKGENGKALAAPARVFMSHRKLEEVEQEVIFKICDQVADYLFLLADEDMDFEFHFGEFLELALTVSTLPTIVVLLKPRMSYLYLSVCLQAELLDMSFVFRKICETMKISMADDGDPLEAIAAWQELQHNLETHRQNALAAKNTRLRRTLKEIDSGGGRDKNLAEMLGAVKEASEKHQAEYNEVDEMMEPTIHNAAADFMTELDQLGTPAEKPAGQFVRAERKPQPTEPVVTRVAEQELVEIPYTQEAEEEKEVEEPPTTREEAQLEAQQEAQLAAQAEAQQEEDEMMSMMLLKKKKQQMVEEKVAKKTKKKQGKTGLAMAMNGREEGSEEACDHYRVDMLAATMGVCKCGHSKSSHSTGAINANGSMQKKDMSKIVV
jgi:hypothetical protein